MLIDSSYLISAKLYKRFRHSFLLILQIFLLLEWDGLFQQPFFDHSLHTNRVIADTWIFPSRKCVSSDRKDFLPQALVVRINFSFHELFRLYEVRWYVTYQRFLQLTHVGSCIDCISRTLFGAFFYPFLFFSLSSHSLNFIKARRKKYR